MTRKMWLVKRHILDATRGLVSVDFYNLINQQKWISVWKQFHQSLDIDACQLFSIFRHDSLLPFFAFLCERFATKASHVAHPMLYGTSWNSTPN